MGIEFTSIDNISNEKVYYLASPYSSSSRLIKQLRYEIISYVGTLLVLEGVNIVEPIASCHEKEVRYKLPGNYAFWSTRDRALISKCDGVIVAVMKGWDVSVGVTDELCYAESLGKDIIYIDVKPLVEEDLKCLI